MRILIFIAGFILGGLTLRASSVVPPTFAELVAESAVIARVEVKATRSVWTESSEGRVIQTVVTFGLRKQLKGKSEAEFNLTFLGGEVGSEGMKIPGMPSFVTGQTDILFVANRGEAQFCPLVALMHGRYRVQKDGATGRMYIARNDGAPLKSEAEVVLPQAEEWLAGRAVDSAGALSPETFEERIQAEVKLHAP